DESETQLSQLDDLIDNRIGRSLSGLLPVSSPYGTEGAMLRTSTDSLYGGPHVSLAVDKVPARHSEIVGVNSSTVIKRSGIPCRAGGNYFRPDDITVALDDSGCPAKITSFFRVKRCVNSAVDDVGTGGLGHFPNFVSSQRVPRMDTDSDDVATLDGCGVQWLECLVDNVRIAILLRRSAGKDKKPTWSDYSCSERDMTWIHEMNLQMRAPGGVVRSGRLLNRSVGRPSNVLAGKPVEQGLTILTPLMLVSSLMTGKWGN